MVDGGWPWFKIGDELAFRGVVVNGAMFRF